MSVIITRKLVNDICVEKQSFIWRNDFLKCEIIFPSYILYKSQMDPEMTTVTSQQPY